VSSTAGYKIVRLAGGAHSVRSLADNETFHPGVGPINEAEALYVRQLRLPQRLHESTEEFVLWDVGLGAAANALTAMRLILAQEYVSPKKLRVVSFDQTTGALEFALQHQGELGYFYEFEKVASDLLNSRAARFSKSGVEIEWTLEPGDFPRFLGDNSRRDRLTTSPHAIMFDPHSPKKNPAMWTVSLFTDLFHRLDPQRPCALATFTRSTLARVGMLLGGWFVGAGHPSGLKEETTVAANRLELIDEPFDRRWLERAKRSDSAEPLREAFHRQSPLVARTWELLQEHRQFWRSEK
jgi:tRNA U34 5-methylaminomethyl-2-thiouridine-forming methyltransferase MnmC